MTPPPLFMQTREEGRKRQQQEEEGKEQPYRPRVQTLIQQMGFMKITVARINSG